MFQEKLKKPSFFKKKKKVKISICSRYWLTVQLKDYEEDVLEWLSLYFSIAGKWWSYNETAYDTVQFGH